MLAGWIVGAGAPDSIEIKNLDLPTQAAFAEAYFETITGKSIFEGTQTNVIHTGHSLGGGLAGYIASLNSSNALVFDQMPFQAAALLRSISHNETLLIDTIIDAITGGTTTEEFVVPDQEGIEAYSTTGEVNAFIRPIAQIVTAVAILKRGHDPLLAAAVLGWSQTAYLALEHTELDSNSGIDRPDELHSMSLLTMLMYAAANDNTTMRNTRAA